MDRLRAFFNLERGEEIPVFLVFSYLTLALTSYMITKAARDGIFLHKFSALTLPYVYIAIAVIIGFVVAFYIRLASRVSQGWLISMSLIFFAALLSSNMEIVASIFKHFVRKLGKGRVR